MKFRLARDQVVLLETVANLCAHRRPAKYLFAVVFSYFLVGRCSKALNDSASPAGNSEFCYTLTSMLKGLGETKLTVSLIASH